MAHQTILEALEETGSSERVARCFVLAPAALLAVVIVIPIVTFNPLGVMVIWTLCAKVFVSPVFFWLTFGLFYVLIRWTPERYRDICRWAQSQWKVLSIALLWAIVCVRQFFRPEVMSAHLDDSGLAANLESAFANGLWCVAGALLIGLLLLPWRLRTSLGRTFTVAAIAGWFAWNLLLTSLLIMVRFAFPVPIA